MAPSAGNVVVIIAGEDRTGAVLKQVQDNLQRVNTSSSGASDSMRRLGDANQHAVSQMAAASASLRALDGDLLHNMRAAERFISMIPGMAAATQAIFPVVGGIALGVGIYEGVDALVKLEQKWWDITYSAKQYEIELGKIADKNWMDFPGIEAAEDRVTTLTADMQRLNAENAKLGTFDPNRPLYALLNHNQRRLNANQSVAEQGELDQATPKAAEEEHRRALQRIHDDQEIAASTGDQIRAIQARAHASEAEATENRRFAREMADIDNEQIRRYNQNRKPGEFAKPLVTGDVGGDEYAEAMRKSRSLAAAETERVQRENSQKLTLEKLRAAEQEGDIMQREQRQSLDIQSRQLEDAHKQGLLSTADYLKQRQKLSDDFYQHQADAGNKLHEQLSSQYDTLSRSSRPEDQQKSLTVLQQMQQLEERLWMLDGERAEKAEQYRQDTWESTQALSKQADTIAATLEHARGTGDVSARLAQSRDDFSDRRRDAVNNYGADSATVRQLDDTQRLQEAEIQLAGMREKMAAIEDAAGARSLAIDQQRLAHTLTQVQAEAQLAAMRQQEMAQLGQLQQQYAGYAQAAGSAGASAMEELNQRINALTEANAKQNTAMEGILHDVFDPLMTSSKNLSKTFKEMSDGLLRDLGRMQEQRLISGIMSMGGGGQPGSAGGGQQARGVGSVGGGVGSLIGRIFGFGRKSGGVASNGGLATGAGTLPDAITSGLQQGTGQGGGSGVTVNLITQGTPQQVSSSSSGGGGSLEQQIISIVLKDADTLGPMSKAIGGAVSMMGNG